MVPPPKNRDRQIGRKKDCFIKLSKNKDRQIRRKKDCLIKFLKVETDRFAERKTAFATKKHAKQQSGQKANSQSVHLFELKGTSHAISNSPCALNFDLFENEFFFLLNCFKLKSHWNLLIAYKMKQIESSIKCQESIPVKEVFYMA